MPRQNRVTPFGEIIATPERGIFMGNRGCLHDAHENLKKNWTTQRWIICIREYKGIQREPMPPGQYTSLFFLDEATALAAGHRPCALCRRDDFNRFRHFWLQANPYFPAGTVPSIDEIDLILHRERVNASKEKITYPAKLSDLPDGTFITLDDPTTAYLVLNGNLLRWSAGGYLEKLTQPTNTSVQVLTPASIVKTLAAGYTPLIHPSKDEV